MPRLERPTPSVSSVNPYYVYGILPTYVIPDYQLGLSTLNKLMPEEEPDYLHWNSGGVVASSTLVNNPGLMGIESGMLGVGQNFGNLSVQIAGTAHKYGYYGGQTTLWGISASASYRFSERVSVTIYGNFYNRNAFMPPVIMGYVASNNFGGYMTVNFNRRWGLDVGASSNYNPYSGRYEFRPNVTPFYRLSNDVKIGADVGGIIYELMRDRKSGPMPGNTTIGPPVNMGPPPVRPHD